MPTTIAVTTPDGHVGRHLVAALVRGGARPRLLSRHPDRTPDALHDLVDVVETDLDDPASVRAATRGVDALHWVSPSPAGDDPVAAYVRHGEIAAAAVRDNGIGRVVFQSSIGAEKRHGVGEIDGLARTELLLEEAAEAVGGAVLHLRCGYFFTNLQPDQLASGVVHVVLTTDLPLAWVAPRDIAEVAAARLLGGGWSGRLVQAVHGPVDLSWDEATAIVSRVTGQPLRAERVSDDAMRASLAGAGLPPGLVEGILGMSTGMRDGFVPEQPRTAVTTTPTTLAAWVTDELAPAMGARGR